MDYDLCHFGEICGAFEWEAVGGFFPFPRSQAGGPLFSYLFLFVAEALSLLLKNACV